MVRGSRKRQPLTIGRVFLVWLVGVLVLTLILVSGLVLRHERRILEAEHAGSVRLAARLLAGALADGEPPERLPTVAMADLRALEVRDRSGRLRWRFGPSPEEARRLDRSLVEVREPVLGPEGGEVVLLASQARVRQHLSASAQRLLGGLVVALLFSLVVGLVLVGRVARPIRELAAAVRQFHPAAPSPIELSVGGAPSAEVVDLSRAFADMTRRLAAHESEKMQAVATLAGGMAHDFNNLLAGILVNLQWLERDPAATAEVVTAVRSLAQEGEEVVQELLLFARRESPPARALDLARLVADQEPMLRHLLSGGVKLEIRSPRNEVPVDGNPVALRRLLLNLVLNASSAIGSCGGTITVTVGAEEEQALLEVSDDGVGIVPEVRARMFEPFFSLRREGRGAGLGLAVVYTVVREHGGAITVDSTPGAGTTVRVRFPLGRDGAPAEPGASAPSPRVLVVEADSRRAAALLEAMAERGLEGRHVLDLSSAHEAVRAWVPDAVVANLAAHGSEGLERVLALGRPVLAVGLGRGEHDSAASERLVGIESPADPARVLEALDRILDRGRVAG